MRTLLKILGTALFLLLLFKQISPDKLLLCFQNINYSYLIVAILILFVAEPLKGYKWHFFVNLADKSVSYWESFKAFLLGVGSRHSIFQKGNRRTSVPRHNKIVDELARKI